MLSTLLAAMPEDYGRYIEPMVGSACLFFAARPRRALLGDFNEALMLTYRAIRSHPRLVSRAASSWGDDSATYYEVRSIGAESLDPIQAAARFTYLNRYSFNGVYRTNKEGRFNVPRGRDSGSLPSEGQFYRCAVALRDAGLMTGDFEQTARLAARGDFVYLDPPYLTERPHHGEYGYGSFDKSDEGRLFVLLRDLDRIGAHFLLSYGGTAPTRDVPRRWHSVNCSSERTVGGKVGSRHVTSEYLLANYELPVLM